MLTVEKIGGTSMSRFDDVIKNIIIANRKPEQMYNRIFVVSAYNNVTNWLLEHKKSGDPGIYSEFESRGNYIEALDNLLGKLIQINKSLFKTGLDINIADEFIASRIHQAKNYLNSLADVLATGYVNKTNILLAAREILSSIGEAHSAFNSVNIIQNHGIESVFIDLSGFNDSEFLTINERIKLGLSGIDFSSTLPIVTGYTKGTEGIMREFDRGYSEVTFSKVAVQVKADEAVIHKEFHLSSADPNIVGVEKSIPVGFTNYNVADQLADVGMEAIHPKAAKPLETAGINIRLKNTFEPEHPGTLISRDFAGDNGKVQIITGTNKVVAIEVHDPQMVGQVGFDLGIMQIFQNHKVSYTLKSTNANSITQVIWENDLKPELIAELEKKYQKVTVMPCALVCALGTSISKPGVIAKATSALAQHNINIAAMSQSLMQVNIQFIINREDYNTAVIALNDALCFKQGR
jgi:aspartate kinase